MVFSLREDQIFMIALKIILINKKVGIAIKKAGQQSYAGEKKNITANNLEHSYWNKNYC